MTDLMNETKKFISNLCVGDKLDVADRTQDQWKISTITTIEKDRIYAKFDNERSYSKQKGIWININLTEENINNIYNKMNKLNKFTPIHIDFNCNQINLLNKYQKRSCTNCFKFNYCSCSIIEFKSKNQCKKCVTLQEYNKLLDLIYNDINKLNIKFNVNIIKIIVNYSIGEMEICYFCQKHISFNTLFDKIKGNDYNGNKIYKYKQNLVCDECRIRQCSEYSKSVKHQRKLTICADKTCYGEEKMILDRDFDGKYYCEYHQQCTICNNSRHLHRSILCVECNGRYCYECLSKQEIGDKYKCNICKIKQEKLKMSSIIKSSIPNNYIQKK
eukprot:494568_1